MNGEAKTRPIKNILPNIFLLLLKGITRREKKGPRMDYMTGGESAHERGEEKHKSKTCP